MRGSDGAGVASAPRRTTCDEPHGACLLCELEALERRRRAWWRAVPRWGTRWAARVPASAPRRRAHRLQQQRRTTDGPATEGWPYTSWWGEALA